MDNRYSFKSAFWVAISCIPLVVLFQNCTQGQFQTLQDPVGFGVYSSSSSSTLPEDDNSFGTYFRPFAADSLWNSKPSILTWTDAGIPKDSYEPVITSGEYSTSVYYASVNDPAVTVYGVVDQESELTRDVVIPHWPPGATSASGSDGHIDIVDSTTGILHSFWVARLENNRWTAKLYAWTKLNGSGFGDPAHYYQGARAAAVPTSAGIIRKHEIDDGKDLYEHALAMSLTYSALSKSGTGYIFPATSADWDFGANYGQIPEGALVMLPSTFDLSKISNVAVRKVAKTLMTYGAYVVDRNTGTPFVIYQEIGTKGIASWQQSADTQQIRSALRMVNVSEYIDGNGKKFKPNLKQNILSMRGAYQMQYGNVASTYDAYNQKRVWAATTTPSREFRYVPLNVAWSKPVAGDMYTVTAHAEGGATFRLQIGDYDSGILKNGESKTFAWPSSGSVVSIIESGVGPSSSVYGTIIKN